MSLGNPLDESTEPGPAQPPRDAALHLDASALKAYAHPLRLRIIGYLKDHGAATATELARHLGESTGQTSYHLRQLARHGLVVDDPARNKGRERWWKPGSFELDAATLLSEDPTLGPAAQAVLSTVVQSRSAALTRWASVALQTPEEWVGVSLHRESNLYLTVEEAAELNQAVQDLIDEHVPRSREREATGALDGTRRMRIYYDAFPLVTDVPDA